MAAAVKVPEGATHTIIEAKRDYVSLLLTQQEADWLYGKLQNYSFTKNDCSIGQTYEKIYIDPEPTEHTMIRSKIFNALLPVTKP